MPLESLGKGKLNIKNITTPEIETDAGVFDPRQEVLGAGFSTWNRIHNDLNELLEKFGETIDFGFPEMAAMLYQLFPEKREELGLNDVVFGKIKENVAELRLCSDWVPLIKLVAAGMVLFPNKTREEFGFTDDVWRRSRDHLNDHINEFKELADIETLVTARRVCPEYSHELEPHRESYDAFLQQMQDGLEQDVHSLYAQTGAELRLLFPERMTKEVIKGLNWKLLREVPRELFEDSFEYTRYLFYRQILAADSIVQTPHGVEFVMSGEQEFKTDVPPLPEIKKG